MFEWNVTQQLGKEYVTPVKDTIYLLIVLIIYQGLNLFSDEPAPPALAVLTSVGTGIWVRWLIVEKLLRVI
jgi:xanthosine utilization system XapX-like protein